MLQLIKQAAAQKLMSKLYYEFPLVGNKLY